MRHWLTGEWVEVPYETDGTRTVVAVVEPTGGTVTKTGNHWRAKGWQGLSLGVHPHQAEAFTAAAHSAGITDVHYDKQTGALCSSSREHRAAEAARRGRYDADGGSVETKYAAAIGY